MKMGIFKQTKQGEVVPKKAPSGHFIVYVGDEHRRFVLNTKMLNNIEFQFLLDMAVDEYDYNYEGGVHIPCQVAFFQAFLKHIKKGECCSPKWIDSELFQAFEEKLKGLHSNE